MRLITSLDVTGGVRRARARDRVRSPIGVRCFLVQEALQQSVPHRTGFADAVEACEHSRAWVGRAAGRMALVYRREDGRVIAQFCHDSSGEWGCAVYSTDGALIGIQNTSLFEGDDAFAASRGDLFGKLGLLFLRWYLLQIPMPSAPLTAELLDFLQEASNSLHSLLRRLDKDVIKSDDQEMLQEVAHTLGASAALALVQENYPFERDLSLVENVRYPLALVIDVLLNYYTVLLERMDPQDDLDLLDRLWWRPLDEHQEDSAARSSFRGDVWVTGAQWEGIAEALLVACKSLCPKIKGWRQAADSLLDALSADEQFLLRGYRRVRGYYFGPFPEENDGQAVSWEKQQQRMEHFSVMREIAHLSVEEFALLDAALLTLAEEQDVRSLIERRSIKDSE